ncbi:MauE/DoxX family redox-associated membrane protein [Bowmanella sp. JS7-9]|uniref:Methylamine utilization protein MauE n=1 Tax=Pseudobowmanella zhangzhouensis TaxID=1537679 RepID=A0ABW1XM72_9ALTE|nr:MauE/DoxX family redox-associated membrane protein [Bowmanella sp. JS7-9]TBX23180.1 glutaredoxin [Bowmanella sp. JS7-9]
MTKRAVLYRMVTDQHICPYGLRSKDLLERQGFTVDDQPLRSRAETDAFKAEHEVKTTPQTFIDGERIGGYDDLCRYFGKPVKDKNRTSYQSVMAIFSVAFLLALAMQWATGQSVFAFSTVMLFVGFAMALLALQKLQDLYSFTNSFITYDVIAMRQLRYAYCYPFLEAWAGLAMIAGLSPVWYAPVAVFIGSVGAASVVKAVYIDQRELKCACVGGNSNVPLGFVSLTENVVMLAAGLWGISQIAAS